MSISSYANATYGGTQCLVSFVLRRVVMTRVRPDKKREDDIMTKRYIKFFNYLI